MKYLTGGAFRRALEDRLRSTSRQDSIPLTRLRKMVAFDRFLARLVQYSPDRWVVKGGLALQLRLINRARTTKDIDLTAIAPDQVIYPVLKNVGALNLGDWFSFLVAQPVRQMPGDFGGTRYPIQALLDGRTFENFHIDIGVGDPMIDPVDYLPTSPVLEFAGLEPTLVPCFPITQQIAEKLHAYTRPRSSGEPSRVKDFIDILLLAELGEIKADGLVQAIQATFHFAATHPLPPMVPAPPRDWASAFGKMADEVGLSNFNLAQAFSAIQAVLDPVLQGKVSGMKWDSATWSWK
jgi:hypothetical protein